MALILGTNRTALLPGLYYTERLIGTNFDDIIYGLRGNDLIEGNNGNDNLYGGQLNSTYIDGNDTLIGGSGNDYLDGGTGRDSLDGGSGDDRLFGRGAIDYLFGGTGHDYLDGGGGNDTLIGGDGSDILVGGGIGADTLAGGNGGVNGDAFIDWFVWRNTTQIGDTVQDFTKGLDKIVLNGTTFGLTRNNTNRVNPAKPVSFNSAVQSNLFTSNRRFYRLHDSDYEQVSASTSIDLDTELINATAKIVAVIPAGADPNDPTAPKASLFYDPNPSNGTNNYELIATFTNGVTPTQTNTNVFDILLY